MCRIFFNDTIDLFFSYTANSILAISNHNSIRVLFDKKNCFRVFYLKKNCIYVFALEMASTGEPALCQPYRHTFAGYTPCVGTL